MNKIDRTEYLQTLQKTSSAGLSVGEIAADYVLKPDIKRGLDKDANGSEESQENLKRIKVQDVQDKPFETIEKSESLDLETAPSPLLELEWSQMPKEWKISFKNEMQKPYFLEMKTNLNNIIHQQKKTVYPLESDIYTFAKLCPKINDIKVVVIGQDPYHNPKEAHGLAFSVQKGITIPPSLRNIYKELENDVSSFKKPNHGCLIGWAEQGVLLLNATLTVEKNKPNSHSKLGWQTFTDSIINHINKNCNNVVFMLWGGFAKKKGSKIDSKKHCILVSNHPSPLSANRGGWFGTKHFSKANDYLIKNNRESIDWNNLP